MKRALLLSAETPSACAAVRGLHLAGFEVAALVEHSFSPAGLSWRCSVTRKTGHWRTEELRAHVTALAPDVILPVSEADLVRLAPLREEIERVAEVVAPPPDVLDVATEKMRARELAEEQGVAIPVQVRLPADTVPEGFLPSDFPAVVKPSRSRAVLHDGRVWSGTARYVNDAEDIQEAHAEFASVGLDTIVERPLRGEAVGVSLLLNAGGEPSLVFVHRRVRELRPEGGPSACAVSHVPEPGLVEPAVRAARALDLLHVPVQMEFRVVRGEPPVLLDINPRPWGTLGLALDCGVNFYGTAAHHSLGEPLPTPPAPYRPGVVRHYLPFELRRVMTLFTGSRQPGYQGDWPMGLDALLGWAFLPHEGMVGRLDDPLPAVGDAIRLLGRAFGMA